MQGDLNARTGVERDFIESDKFDASGVENFSKYSCRNSEDKKVNKRGKDLLDLCKVNDLLITNGRKIGDLFGKFTSHQWNGSALNDYLLTPNYFMDKIVSFAVGDYVPWLSDHCPIFSSIMLKNLKTCEKSLNNCAETEPSFIFDANSKIRFLNGLKDHEMTQKISQLLENENISASVLGDEIKTMLINNARKCKIKTKKKTILETPLELGLMGSAIKPKMKLES